MLSLVKNLNTISKIKTPMYICGYKKQTPRKTHLEL